MNKLLNKFYAIAGFFFLSFNFSCYIFPRFGLCLWFSSMTCSEEFKINRSGAVHYKVNPPKAKCWLTFG